MKSFKRLGRFFLLGLMVLSLAIAGCEGDDGDDGAPGAAGPAGPAGPPGAPADPGAQLANETCSVCHGPGGIRAIDEVHPDPFANTLTFSSFSVNTTDLTAVSVTFAVAGPSGPITDDPGVNFSGRFTFAKLLPGATPQDQSFWQSYINQVEVGDVGPVEGAPAALAQAVQATSESSGTLAFDVTTGLWTYTFAFDFSQVGVTDVNGDGTADVTAGTLDFAPGNLNRISGQFSANEVAVGESGLLVQTVLRGNPVFDFVPNGGVPPVASREVAVTDSCNACHRELALHGGNRFLVEYCVTCHNPGSTDANSGNSVDMTSLIHKIHYGENLPSVEAGEPYIIVGYRDSIHDYSTVVWPGFPIGTPLACETCHDPAAAADALNYQSVPTMNACGSCHDNIDFATGANHGTDVAPGGIIQTSNANCTLCHPATGPGAIGKSVAVAHQIFQLTEAADFQYNIVGTTFDAATRQLAITFSVTDPRPGAGVDPAVGSNWNILTDTPFTTFAGGASRLFILVGWDPQEFHNTGSGAAPAQPIAISTLSNAATPATDNGDGTFSVTAAIPAGVNAVTVAVDGHPAIPNPDTTVPTPATLRIPVKNAFARVNTGAAPTARRAIVDIDKCNGCHGTLSLHGNNRTNEIEVCVICHNPNATDIDVRPATLDTTPADGVFDDFAAAGVDSKREEPIDFKRMIHAIHAGGPSHGIRDAGVVVYGFGRSIHDYSEVRYPTGQNNCDMCHIAGPPTLPLADAVLGTTVRTADAVLDGNQAAIDAALADPADDLNISPTAAACSACHDSGLIQGHMEANGASFGVLQENIQ